MSPIGSAVSAVNSGPWGKAAAFSSFGRRKENEDQFVLLCNGLVTKVEPLVKPAATAPCLPAGGLFDDLPETVAGPSLPVVEKTDDDCLVAVLDGHGGDCASKLCTQLIAAELQEQLEAAGRESAESRRVAVEGVFLALDRHLKTKLGPAACRYCGSTCVFAFAWLDDEAPGKFRLLLANLGDSRGMVLRAGPKGGLKLDGESEDHKPESAEETRRILAAGGKVGIHAEDVGKRPRVDMQLGCARALGDFGYKEDAALLPEDQKVSIRPDIYEFFCDFGDAVVLASDGALDVLSSDAIAAIVAKALQASDDPAVAAEAVVKAALAQPNQEDNCTCVVFRT